MQPRFSPRRRRCNHFGASRWTRGGWLVQRERAQIDYGPPSDALPDAAPIAETIPQVLEKLGLEGQRWLSELLAAWSDVAGADIAAHTRPGRLDGSTLTVFVDSSVWLNELSRYCSGEILARIQARFGTERVARLRLQLDPEPRGR